MGPNGSDPDGSRRRGGVGAPTRPAPRGARKATPKPPRAGDAARATRRRAAPLPTPPRARRLQAGQRRAGARGGSAAAGTCAWRSQSNAAPPAHRAPPTSVRCGRGTPPRRPRRRVLGAAARGAAPPRRGGGARPAAAAWPAAGGGEAAPPGAREGARAAVALRDSRRAVLYAGGGAVWRPGAASVAAAPDSWLRRAHIWEPRAAWGHRAAPLGLRDAQGPTRGDRVVNRGGCVSVRRVPHARACGWAQRQRENTKVHEYLSMRLCHPLTNCARLSLQVAGPGAGARPAAGGQRRGGRGNGAAVAADAANRLGAPGAAGAGAAAPGGQHR